MKKSVIIAAVVAAMACVSPVNAQEPQNKLGLSDFGYRTTQLEKRYYTDHYWYSVGTDPNEYKNCTMQKHGAFIGVVAGVQAFDGKVTPNIGGTLGWEGKQVGFDYVGTFARGNYTNEADRSNSYVEFDSKLAIKAKLLDTNAHDWQLWIGAYGSYKLNFDYHKNESEVVTVRETDEEIVTTHEKVGNDYEFKGSSMGAGGQLELVWRPYMSKVQYRLVAWGGAQQRYYDDGNRWKPEFGAEVKVTFNFNAQKIWDLEFLKKTGFSKKQVKELNKARRTVELY